MTFSLNVLRRISEQHKYLEKGIGLKMRFSLNVLRRISEQHKYLEKQSTFQSWKKLKKFEKIDVRRFRYIFYRVSIGWVRGEKIVISLCKRCFKTNMKLFNLYMRGMISKILITVLKQTNTQAASWKSSSCYCSLCCFCKSKHAVFPSTHPLLHDDKDRRKWDAGNEVMDADWC